MKRKRFEELMDKLHKEVVRMVDQDESVSFIQNYLIKAVTAHSPRDNPNFTARQLSMIFEMAREPRKEIEHGRTRKEK